MTESGNRVAIVTGAGTGIGQAIAIGLAEAGVDCVITGRRSEPLQDTIARAPAGRVTAIGGDITEDADRRRVVAETAGRFGRIDILVNNAGVSSIAPLLAATEADWRKVMATNVDAAFFMAQQVLPIMRDRGWGRIVNIGSVYGVLGLNPAFYDVFTDDPVLGPKRQPAYHTSKGAILNLTRDLAIAVAKWGVTVNNVSPGMVITEQSDGLLSDSVKQRLCDMTPVGRFGEPKEIAHAVRFLASEEAAFITGQDIRVDGGWTIW
jgi:NAD(P)-dependent dehydrogenase (short-subunit alcohol dehydrogenase family)